MKRTSSEVDVKVVRKLKKIEKQLKKLKELIEDLLVYFEP